MKRVLFLSLFLVGCSAHRVEDIRKRAPEFLNQRSLEIVAEQGFQYGGAPCFGGRVWYTLRRIPDNGILYEGYVCRWGDELQLYSFAAVDAIKP